jgi:hypothetical protein
VHLFKILNDFNCTWVSQIDGPLFFRGLFVLIFKFICFRPGLKREFVSYRVQVDGKKDDNICETSKFSTSIHSMIFPIHFRNYKASFFIRQVFKSLRELPYLSAKLQNSSFHVLSSLYFLMNVASPLLVGLPHVFQKWPLSRSEETFAAFAQSSKAQRRALPFEAGN